MSRQEFRPLSNLPYAWFRGLEGQEKKDFEIYLRNSRPILDKLSEIITAQIEVLDRKQLQDEFYNNPELVSRLAFVNGQMKAYVTILSLLTLKDANDH